MIDRLEKKIGKYAIKHLIFYILAGYVLGYILYFISSRGNVDIYSWLVLSPALVMRGQVWRLFTWVITIPSQLSFWIIFMFLFFYFIGRSLEETLGAFRYNLYIFSGWLFTTVGAMILYGIMCLAGGSFSGLLSSAAMSGAINTYHINMASFLAFAVLYPDVKVYFFGILPIKIKVLAWIDVGILGFEVIEYISAIILLAVKDWDLMREAIAQSGLSDMNNEILGYYSIEVCITTVVCILISFLNFLVFFMMNRKKRFDANRRKAEFERKSAQGRAQGAAFMNGRANASGENASAGPKKTFRPDNAGGLVHKCEVCGRTSVTNPELQFRYCSKCEGNHEYCQDHLFTHVHIK